MNEYLPVAILMLIAGAIGAIMMFMGGLIRPKKYDKVKNSVYECGMPEFSDARKRYNVRFYIVALLFCSLRCRNSVSLSVGCRFRRYRGFYGLVAMFMFLIILVIGFLYEWKKELWNGCNDE
ncbi:MAG: NADH-quinone oxidoreductase subunit A [Geovibrio sp.]|nr:NADH-quinone oxidoreductase subunit A [Geovibrio sp.]